MSSLLRFDVVGPVLGSLLALVSLWCISCGWIETPDNVQLITAWLVTALTWSACIVGGISLFTYISLYVGTLFFGEQDLKRKYNAEWALITGGSSGIGLCLAKRLAAQGVNLIIAAYPDKHLEGSVRALEEEFEGVEIRSLGCDFTATDPTTYLDELEELTSDIDVQLVFSNAGFIRTGFFDATTLQTQLSVHNCNATAAMSIAHHFLRRLVDSKLRGCVVFTSSPAGFFGSPFASLYGSTKAYLTELALSIAPEVHGLGIDVAVVHPSPVASNFYSGAKHSIDFLELFKATGVGPEVVVGALLAGVGRRVVIDQGYYSGVARMMTKIADSTFLGELITRLAPSLPDYIAMREGLASETTTKAKSSSSSSKRNTTPTRSKRRRGSSSGKKKTK